MLIFSLVVLSMFLASVLWWIWADRQLRALPGSIWSRLAMAVFMLLCIGGYCAVIGSRLAGARGDLPVGLIAITIIWHIAILPLAALILLASGVDLVLTRLRRSPVGRPPHPDSDAPASPVSREAPSSGPVLNRRQLIVGAAVAAPPMLTGIGLVKGFAEMESFRIREMDIALPDLPRALDGLRIVHVSDVHIGKFTRGETLKKIVDRVNALRSDLVVMTGDVIDYDLADLPAGVDILRRMEAAHGLYACEGNHDLFMSREGFEDGMRSAGIPLLVNAQRTLRIRGTPVQLLGLRWGGDGGRSALIEQNAKELQSAVDPEAFKILLAHHPHAFDAAADLGAALTFSGHTHGGQLMLTEDLGPGAMMYRYWSGLYHQKGRAAVVSNGVGNWFPVRINAPAEIIHATLRRADA